MEKHELTLTEVEEIIKLIEADDYYVDNNGLESEDKLTFITTEMDDEDHSVHVYMGCEEDTCRFGLSFFVENLVEVGDYTIYLKQWDNGDRSNIYVSDDASYELPHDKTALHKLTEAINEVVDYYDFDDITNYPEIGESFEKDWPKDQLIEEIEDQLNELKDVYDSELYEQDGYIYLLPEDGEKDGMEDALPTTSHGAAIVLAECVEDRLY